MSDDASFTLTLINKITKPARDATRSLDAVQKTLKRLNAAADSSFVGKRGSDSMSRFAGMQGGIMRQFQGMGAQLRGPIASGVSSLGAGLAVASATTGVLAGVLGGSLVKGADFAQRSMLGFNALLKDGPAARAMFDDTRAMAQRLGLDVYATTQTMTRFLSLGFKGPLANDLIKAGADLRMFGATAEGVDRIFAQIGQMQAKGKLQGEELMVLAENGVDLKKVYAALGKQLGKTTDQIIQMQGAGQLTSDMAFPAILSAIKEMTGTTNLGDAAETAASSTLSGMKDVLVAGWQNLMIDLGESSAPALTAAFKDIAKVLEDAMGGTTLREGIVDTVTAVAQGVRDAIPYVQKFVGGFLDGFGAAWPVLQRMLSVLVDGFGNNPQWLQTAITFGEKLGELAAFTIGATVAIGGILVAVAQLSVALGGALFGALDWVTSGLRSVGAAIDWLALSGHAVLRGFVTGTIGLAGEFITGLVNGIKSGAQWVIDAVSNLGSAMIAAIKRKLGIFSPSRVMEKMGLFTGAGLEVGVVGSIAGVEKATAQLASAATISPASMGVTAPTVAPVPAGAGGRATMNNTWNLTFPVLPGATREEGERMGEGFMAVIDRRFAALLEGESLGGAY